MNSWKCTLEVVTPLFLAGADQTEAELRSPAFKGLLRWWYRAAKGELSPEEERLFGATEQAAKCRIRLKPESIKTELFNKYRYNSETEKGILYLGFSLDTKVQGEHRKRKFIRPGSTFQLELSMVASLTNSDKKALLGALWLMIWLGGVGTRCRRGFGSLVVKQADLIEIDLPDTQQKLQFKFQGNPNNLKDFLLQNLAIARSWVGFTGPAIALPKFTVLNPNNTQLYLWNVPFKGYLEAINTAGQILMAYRGKKSSYDNEVKKVMQDKYYKPDKKATVERAAFGLPIQFYFRSGGRATVVGKSSEEGGHERRASPLFIKVLKINDHEYALLFLLMKAEILEIGERIIIKPDRGAPEFVDQPSTKIIEDFLKEEVDPNSTRIKL